MPDRDTSAPKPAAPVRAGGVTEPDLWCVHILGPDDVYPAPDIVTAARWAAAMNSAAIPFNQDVSDDDFVLCHANVERWDGSPEDHAAGLDRATKQMASKRGVIPRGQVVEIDYTNHEGKRAVRKIKPTGRMLVGLDRWHPDVPWLIEARDVERGVIRTFDPSKIHRWDAASPLASVANDARTAVAAVVRCAWDVLDGSLEPRDGVTARVAPILIDHLRSAIAAMQSLVKDDGLPRAGDAVVNALWPAAPARPAAATGSDEVESLIRAYGGALTAALKDGAVWDHAKPEEDALRSAIASRDAEITKLKAALSKCQGPSFLDALAIVEAFARHPQPIDGVQALLRQLRERLFAAATEGA